MKTKETLEQFDGFLGKRGLNLTAVIIGGAALNLLGVISRETRDCDILHPDLPESIRKASEDFADELQSKGIPLEKDWLNNGPASVSDLLPKGWMKRTRSVFQGKALSLSTLGRTDLIKTKLFAFCDRGRDQEDCIALKPSADELREALGWLKDQDAHPDWPQYVETTIKALAERLGYEL
jgi:hypothetical protein